MDITTPVPLAIGPAARVLRVRVAWLREEALAGRVPCLRAGSQLLFNIEAVRKELLERAATERCQAPNPEGAAHA